MRSSLWPRLLLIFAMPVFACAASPLKASKHAALTFPDGKTIQVDVVDTPQDRERGLMFRRGLPQDYGMLFVFARQAPMQFWMKNTIVPLDMVFIGADKTIAKIHRRVKASALDTPEDAVARASGEAQFVLELPAGAGARHKLKEAQKLSFDVVIPPR